MAVMTNDDFEHRFRVEARRMRRLWRAERRQARARAFVRFLFPGITKR